MRGLFLLLLGLGSSHGSVIGVSTQSFLTKKVGELTASLVERCDLQIGEVSTSLGTSWTLRDLRLMDERGRQLMSIDRLEAKLDLSALFTGELVVDTMELRDLHVRMDSGDEGWDCLSSRTDEPWEGSPMHMVAKSVVLKRGTIRMHDAASNTERRFESLSGSLGFDLKDRTIQFQKLNFSGRLVEGDKSWPLSLRGRMISDRDTLRIPGITLTHGSSQATLAGQIRGTGTRPNLQLGLKAKLGTELLTELLEEGAPLAALQADLKLIGPLDALAISGPLSGPSGQVGLEATLDLAADTLTHHGRLNIAIPDLQRWAPTLDLPIAAELTAHFRGEGSTWPDGLRATVEVSEGHLRVDGEDLDEIQLQAEAVGGEVVIRELSLQHRAGSLSTRGTVDVAARTAELSSSANIWRLSAIPDVDGLRGEARFNGTITLDASDDVLAYGLDGTWSTDSLATEAMEIAMGEGRLTLSQDPRGLRGAGTASLSALEASGGRLESFQADWELQALTAQRSELVATWEAETLTGPPLADLGATMGAARLHGQAKLRLEFGAEDPLRALDLDARVDGLTLGPGAHPAEGGHLSAQWSPEELHVDLDLAHAQGPLLRGRVDGDLRTGQWVLSDLALGLPESGAWASTRPVAIQVDEGGVTGLDVALVGENGTLQLMGSWHEEAGRDLAIAIDSLDLAPLSVVAQALLDDASLPRLAGQLTAAVALKGGDEPQSGTLLGELTLQGLSVQDRIADLDMDAQLSGPWTRPELRATLSAGENTGLAELHLALPLEEGAPMCAGDADASLWLRPVALAELQPHLPGWTLPTGDVSLEINAQGPLCDPELDLVGAASLGVAHGRLRTDLQLRRRAGRTEVDGMLSARHRPWVTLRGSIEDRLADQLPGILSGDQTPAPEGLVGPLSAWISAWDLRITPLELPLSTLVNLSAPGTPVEGQLIGALQLTGSPGAPVIDGGLIVMGGRLGSADLTLGHLSLSSSGSTLVLSSALDFGEKGGLLAHGQLPMDLASAPDLDAWLSQPGLVLDLTGDGVPLGLLEGHGRMLQDASGRVQIEGAIRGSLANPEAELTLNLQSGAISVLPLGLRLEGWEATISHRGDTLTIEDFRGETQPISGRHQGRAAGGDFSLEGTARFGELSLQDVVLQGRFDDLWFAATPEAHLALTGEFSATGGWPGLKIRGEAKVTEALIHPGPERFRETVDLSVHPSIRVHRSDVQAMGTRADPLSLPPELDLDILLDLNHSFHITSEIPLQERYGRQFAKLSTLGLDADMDGAGLHAKILQGQPILLGAVDFTRGTTSVMGSRLDISEGRISFVGDDIFNPILDIVASKEMGKHGTTSATIRGSLEEMSITLDNDVYPDQADIVSLLLFGQPVAEIADAEGQAGAALLGVALSSVTDRVSRAVGTAFLQQLEVTGSAVRVGLPIADNLFLALAIQATTDDSENAREASLEWTINRRIYAELITGDQGNSSADLYWRWRF